jgi:hypothetical protein
VVAAESAAAFAPGTYAIAKMRLRIDKSEDNLRTTIKSL